MSPNTLYVFFFFYIILFYLKNFFLHMYLTSPSLPFDHHRKCQVSLLFSCLLILLPSYFFVILYPLSWLDWILRT